MATKVDDIARAIEQAQASGDLESVEALERYRDILVEETKKADGSLADSQPEPIGALQSSPSPTRRTPSERKAEKQSQRKQNKIDLARSQYESDRALAAQQPEVPREEVEQFLKESGVELSQEAYGALPRSKDNQQIVRDPKTGQLRWTALSPEQLKLVEEKKSPLLRIPGQLTAVVYEQLGGRLQAREEEINRLQSIQATIWSRLPIGERERVRNDLAREYGVSPDKLTDEVIAEKISPQALYSSLEKNPRTKELFPEIEESLGSATSKGEYRKLFFDALRGALNKGREALGEGPVNAPISGFSPSMIDPTFWNRVGNKAIDVTESALDVAEPAVGTLTAPFTDRGETRFGQWAEVAKSGGTVSQFYDAVIAEPFEKIAGKQPSEWVGEDIPDALRKAVLTKEQERKRTEVDYFPEGTTFGDIFDKETWTDPNTALPWNDLEAFLIKGVDQLPYLVESIVAARLGGRFGANQAMKDYAGSSLKQIEKMRQRYAGLGGIVSGGMAEGAMIYDQVRMDVMDSIDAIPMERLRKDERFQELILAGATEEDAKKILQTEAATSAGKLAWVISGVILGSPMQYLFGKSAAGRLFDKNRTGRVIGAALGDPLQEGFQELGEGEISDYGIATLDPENPIFKDKGRRLARWGSGVFGVGPVSAVSAVGALSPSKPVGYEDNQIEAAEAAKKFYEARDARYSHELRITDPDYIATTPSHQRIQEMHKLEELQKAEAEAIMEMVDPVKEFLGQRGGRSTEAELAMLGSLQTYANSILTDLAVAESERKSTLAVAEETQRIMKERAEIQNRVNEKVLTLSDIESQIEAIESIQELGDVNEDAAQELVRMDYARQRDDGTYVLKPKGARALNLLKEQQRNLRSALGAGFTGEERRTEDGMSLRAKIDQMSDEEVEQLLYRRTLTRLKNRRAMNERVKNDPNAKAFAFADVDALSWVNDNMGHNAGDRMLMAIGSAFQEVVDKRAEADVYHVSGDEFVVSAPTQEMAEEIMQEVRQRLSENRVRGGNDEVTPTITWGTGNTVEEADQAGNDMARLRQQEGKRPRKGGKPVTHRDLSETRGPMFHEDDIENTKQRRKRKSIRQVVDDGDSGGFSMIDFNESWGRDASWTESDYQTAAWQELRDEIVEKAEPNEKSAAQRLAKRLMDLGKPIDEIYSRVSEKFSLNLKGGMAKTQLNALRRAQKTEGPRNAGEEIQEQIDLETTLTKWSQIRQMVQEGDEVEIVTPDGVQTGTVVKVKSIRGKSRVSVYFDGQIFVFNPEGNWLIRPDADSTANQVLEANWPEAVTQADSNGAVYKTINLGAFSREGIAYANLAASEEFTYYSPAEQKVNFVQDKSDSTENLIKSVVNNLGREEFASLSELASLISPYMESTYGDDVQIFAASLLLADEGFSPLNEESLTKAFEELPSELAAPVSAVLNRFPGHTRGQKLVSLVRAAESKTLLERANLSRVDYDSFTEEELNNLTDKERRFFEYQLSTRHWRKADDSGILDDKFGARWHILDWRIGKKQSKARLQSAKKKGITHDQRSYPVERKRKFTIDEMVDRFGFDRQEAEESIDKLTDLAIEKQKELNREVGKLFGAATRLKNLDARDVKRKLKQLKGLGDHLRDSYASLRDALPESDSVYTVKQIKAQLQKNKNEEHYGSLNPRSSKERMQQAEAVKHGAFHRYTNLPNITLHASYDDLPSYIKEQIEREGGNPMSVRGYFDHDYPENGVHVIVPNAWAATKYRYKDLTDKEVMERSIAETLFHEIVGHFGVRGIFGDEAVLRDMMFNLVDAMPARKRNAHAARLGLSLVDPRGTERWNDMTEFEQKSAVAQYEANKQLAGEEYIAYIAGAELGKRADLTPRERGIIEKIYDWIKRFFVRKGFDKYFHGSPERLVKKVKKGYNLTDDDVADIIKRAQDFVRYGKEWNWTKLGGNPQNIVGKNLLYMRDGDVFIHGLTVAINDAYIEQEVYRTEKKDYKFNTSGELKRLKKQLSKSGIEGEVVRERHPIFRDKMTPQELLDALRMAEEQGYISKDEARIQRLNEFINTDWTKNIANIYRSVTGRNPNKKQINLIKEGKLAELKLAEVVQDQLESAIEAEKSNGILNYRRVFANISGASNKGWWVESLPYNLERQMTAAQTIMWGLGGRTLDDSVISSDKVLSREQAIEVLLTSPTKREVLTDEGDIIEVGGHQLGEVPLDKIELLSNSPAALSYLANETVEEILDTPVPPKGLVPKEVLLNYLAGDQAVRVKFGTLSGEVDPILDRPREIAAFATGKAIEDIPSDVRYALREQEWDDPELTAFFTPEEIDLIKAEFDDVRSGGMFTGYDPNTGTWFDPGITHADHTSYFPNRNAAVPETFRNFAIYYEGRGPIFAVDTQHEDHLSNHSFSDYSGIPSGGTTLGHVRSALVYSADANPPIAPNPAHQGMMWYMGEMQSNWFQWLSAGFRSQEEQQAAKPKMRKNISALHNRAATLFTGIGAVLKTETKNRLSVPLIEQEQIEVAKIVIDGWRQINSENHSTWLALRGAGDEQEAYRWVLDQPEGQAELRKRQLLNVERKFLTPLIEAIDNVLDEQFKPLNELDQTIGDARLHETLDTEVVRQALNTLRGVVADARRNAVDGAAAIGYLPGGTSLPFANDVENINDYIDKVYLSFSNAASFVKRGSQLPQGPEHWQSRIPVVASQFGDVVKRALALRNINTKPLDPIISGVDASSEVIVKIPNAAFEDFKAIDNTMGGNSGVDTHIQLAMSYAVAAGANPGVTYSATRNELTPEIDITITGDPDLLEEAATKVPEIIRYYLKNTYSVDWNNSEQERIDEIISESMSEAWRNVRDITWDEIDQSVFFTEELDLSGDGSNLTAEQLTFIERVGIKTRQQFIAENIEYLTENNPSQRSQYFDRNLAQLEPQELTDENGVTLDKNHPEYQRILTEDNTEFERRVREAGMTPQTDKEVLAGRWLSQQAEEARQRLIEKVFSPGGDFYEQARRNVEAEYDNDPSGLVWGTVPYKFAEPLPGFRHGEVTETRTVALYKVRPGKTWRFSIGGEALNSATSLDQLKEQTPAYYFKDWAIYYAPNLITNNWQEYFQKFPNPILDTDKILTEDDVPSNPEPDWDEIANVIENNILDPLPPRAQPDSDKLFTETVNIWKKVMSRRGVIPETPLSPDNIWRVIFLKGILAEAVRRGVPEVAWSPGLATSVRGGGGMGVDSYVEADEVHWQIEEGGTIRGQEGKHLVVTLKGSNVNTYTSPIVLDMSQLDSVVGALGARLRKYILEQAAGNKPLNSAAVQSTTPTPNDLLISSANIGGSRMYFLTRIGSSEILDQSRDEAEIIEKKDRLFRQAEERGSWESAITSSMEMDSVTGGTITKRGVVTPSDMGYLSPIKVTAGPSWDRIGMSNPYIPTVFSANAPGYSRAWWITRGGRISYEEMTVRHWNNWLKEKFGVEVGTGKLKVSEWDNAFSEIGEHRVPATPRTLAQRHGEITVEQLQGNRTGYVITGENGLVIPDVFDSPEDAVKALDNLIENEGERFRAAEVFKIVITDEMRDYFSKPVPMLHYDPYEDPILKDAAEKVGRRLPRFMDRLRQFRSMWRNEWAQGQWDRFHGLKYALKEADIWDDMDPRANPYIAARLSTSLESIMKAIMENGYPIWAEGMTQTAGKGFLEIIEPVHNDMDTWAMYMAGRRAKNLLLEGLDKLDSKASEIGGAKGAELRAMRQMIMKAAATFDGVDDADKVMAMLEYVTAPDKHYRDDKNTVHNKLRSDYQAGDTAFAKAIEQMREYGREKNFEMWQIRRMANLDQHFPHFNKVRLDYAEWNSRLLDYAQEAGVINAETREMWESADYIPFYRVADDRMIGGLSKGNGIANQPQQIRRLSGSEANVGDLVHNMMVKMTGLVDASIKNHAAVLAVDALRESGIVSSRPKEMKPEFIEMGSIRRKLIKAGMDPDAIPEGALEGFQKQFAVKAPKGDNVISILRNGQMEYYETDNELLLRALTNLNMKQWHWTMNLLRDPKKLYTTFITLDPGFMGANFIRDTLSAFVLSRDKMIPVASAVKGFYDIATNAEAIQVMRAAGGAFESGFIRQGDERATRKYLKRAMKNKSFAATVLDSPFKLFRAYQALGSWIENSNRVAVYNAAIRAGKPKVQAVYEAKDLMDFSMHGDWGVIQWLVTTVPFFGARQSGLYRLGRGFLEDPIGFALKGMMLTFASVALWLMFRDDERYKALEDWDKDTYHHFWLGDLHFRIPKAFEIGAIFSTIPERIMEYIWSNENDAGRLLLKRFGHMIGETFSMNPIPHTVMPLAEMYFNYDFFRNREIVSPYEERRLAPDEYRYYTSPTMIELARAMPGGLDTASGKIRSPLHLQHLFQGYFGTLGRYALMVSDAVVRELSDYPEPPDWGPAQTPVLNRFYTGDQPLRTKYEEKTYEMLWKISEIQGSLSFHKKTRQRDLMKDVREDWKPYIRIAKRMENIRENISEVNNRITRIWLDDNKTGAQKRIEIDRLQERKNTLFKRAYDLRPEAQESPQQITQEDVIDLIDNYGVDNSQAYLQRIQENAPDTAELLRMIDEDMSKAGLISLGKQTIH